MSSTRRLTLMAAAVFFAATGALAQDGPQLGNVTPVLGTANPGVSRVFTFTASYTAPWDQNELDVEIDPNGGSNTCYVVFGYVPGGLQQGISLYDDSTED